MVKEPEKDDVRIDIEDGEPCLRIFDGKNWKSAPTLRESPFWAGMVERARSEGIKVYCPACGVWNFCEDFLGEISPGSRKWKCTNCETEFELRIEYHETKQGRGSENPDPLF